MNVKDTVEKILHTTSWYRKERGERYFTVGVAYCAAVVAPLPAVRDNNPSVYYGTVVAPQIRALFSELNEQSSFRVAEALELTKELWLHRHGILHPKTTSINSWTGIAVSKEQIPAIYLEDLKEICDESGEYVNLRGVASLLKVMEEYFQTDSAEDEVRSGY